MAAASKTMRALVLDTSLARRGIENALRINPSSSHPTSKPLAQDQVLVEVHAAGLNPVDYKLAELPLINRLVYGSTGTPGLDFAGKVTAVGPVSSAKKEHTLREGQTVFGRIPKPGNGTLAEYTLTNLDGCVALPTGISFADAAGLGTVGQTAFQCIAPFVTRDTGAAVFINGGSGGCGTMGIQIAKALGCFVVTTCSERNVDYCKSLGADEVIDYTKGDVVEALGNRGLQFNLLVDNVGGTTQIFTACHDFTRPDATYVQVGAGMNLGSILALLKCAMLPSFLGGGQRKFRFVGVTNKADQLAQMGQWMKEGRLKVNIEGSYPLEEAGKAYAVLKKGRTRGKLIVNVRE